MAHCLLPICSLLPARCLGESGPCPSLGCWARLLVKNHRPVIPFCSRPQRALAGHTSNNMGKVHRKIIGNLSNLYVQNQQGIILNLD